MQYLLFMWRVSTCMIVWLVARDSGSLMQWNVCKIRLGFTAVWLRFHVFWSVMVRRLFCSVWNAAVCEGMCKPRLSFVPYIWRILHLCNRVEEVLRTRVSWRGVCKWGWVEEMLEMMVCWRGVMNRIVEEVLQMRVCWKGVMNVGKLKRCCEQGCVEEVLWKRVCWRGVVNGVSLRGVVNGSNVECHPWDSYRESQIIELCNWICNIASAIMMVYVMVIYKVVQIWPGLMSPDLHTNSPGHIWTTLYITAKSTVCIPNTAVLENT